MHWPKSPSWNAPRLCRRRRLSCIEPLQKLLGLGGTSNVPIIFLRWDQSKWLLPKRKKTKFCWSLLYSLSCSNLSKANLHGFLLFLCAHPFVVRTTTFTFTYCGVQGEWTQLLWHNMRGRWMDEWWRDGSILLSTQLRFIHNWVRKEFQPSPLVTDLDFVHCNWFISRFHPLKLTLGSSILKFTHLHLKCSGMK